MWECLLYTQKFILYFSNKIIALSRLTMGARVVDPLAYNLPVGPGFWSHGFQQRVTKINLDPKVDLCFFSVIWNNNFRSPLLTLS